MTQEIRRNENFTFLRSDDNLLMHLPADLETLLAPAADCALIVGESGSVLFATDQACRLLKYAPGALDGQIVGEHSVNPVI